MPDIIALEGVTKEYGTAVKTLALRGVTFRVADKEFLSKRKRAAFRNEHLGKRADQLSGGQRQRVAIGRALMNSPDILLADEPTGNLDTVNSAMVYHLFRRIHDQLGTTFVIVTHDRSIAQQTDRIIEVTDGQVSQDVLNDYVERPASA